MCRLITLCWLFFFFITNPGGHHPSVLFFQLSQKSNIVVYERHILIMVWGEAHVKSVHKCLKFPPASLHMFLQMFLQFSQCLAFLPMLTTELIAEPPWSESDTAEMLLIWWYVHCVYSECCEAFFINSWEEIISSEDLLLSSWSWSFLFCFHSFLLIHSQLWTVFKRSPIWSQWQCSCWL